MKISQTNNGPVTILKLEGHLDSTTSSTLQAQLLPLMEAASARVAVDMTAVEYVSSAGLRIVLMAAKKAQTSGARIAIFGLSNPVRETFEISGFSRLISIVETEVDALKALTA
ncbi:MAG: STAS domain-containing protein [Pseudolabrys sp.]|nr:STAS domain-containing protein [Pseudolabrys sp.]